MKVKIMVLIFSSLLFASCSNDTKNPLLSKWDTPFETPPFNLIEEAHYLPAYYDAMELHNAEINAIVNNSETPTFENTIVAFENSGKMLTRISRIFGAMDGAMNNDKIQSISKEIYPKLSQHFDNINMNDKLFKKVKYLFDKIDELNLSGEEKIVLKNHYNDFVRGGANLSPEDKIEFSKINGELSTLTIQFGENVLAETNNFELVIDNKNDLEGLNADIIANAAETAKEKGHDGKWVFTIQKPSLLPFIQYSAKRDLREKIYTAYFMKGDNNNKLDNKETLIRIANLRLKRANLLGFKSHADFVLDVQMAKNPANVNMLLQKVWTPAIKKAKEERAEMQKIIDKEGKKFKLASWDWWYYAEKVKKEKYNFDENEVRPYFEVNNVIKGVFGLATNLFNITFEERNDIQKYHPEVKVFEVKEKNGKHIGILYTDYFPRASKRAGAWMDAFRKQYRQNGEMVTPIIYNVGNFSKPIGDKPALISLDEVLTLFHEFGHALHGLFADGPYDRTAGSVPRDFVELPSQFMENFAADPEIIKVYAKHYKTGEVIPEALIKKLKDANSFNGGFATVEYMAAAYLDMYWHTLEAPTEMGVNEFEAQKMNELGLIDEIIPEPFGGAQRNQKDTIKNIDDFLVKVLKNYTGMSSKDIVVDRYSKFRKLATP